MSIKNGYTVCLVIGVIMLIVTSAIWSRYENVPFISGQNLGEFIYLTGQGFSALLIYIWGLKRAANNVEKVIMLLLIDLAIIDTVSIIFSNPFIHNWSKTINVIVVILFSIYKLYQIFKKKK